MDEPLPTIGEGAIIDRLTQALVAGNADAARECLTDDAVIWHNFDAVAQNYEMAATGWQALFRNFSNLRFTDVRRTAIPGGFVQQHLMGATTSSGEHIAWAVVIIVRLRDGKIARFEEYMDRAGRLSVGPEQVSTPGLMAMV